MINYRRLLNSKEYYAVTEKKESGILCKDITIQRSWEQFEANGSSNKCLYHEGAEETNALEKEVKACAPYPPHTNLNNVSSKG